MANDGRPVAPPELQIYNSYETDPNYATAFTITWASAAALCALVALPRLIRSARQGRLTAGLRGLGEDFEHEAYQPIVDDANEKKLLYADTEGSSRPGLASNQGWSVRARGWAAALGTLTLYSPPYAGLDLGQIFVIFGYLVTLIVCILHKSHIRDNGNRAGFLVLAQLSIVFLLATKNNVLAVLMSRGWEKLNFLHRWAGRGVFLSATIHGASWINNHIRISPSALKERKEMLGMAAYGVLCVIVLSSSRPVRFAAYQFFFIVHIVGYVSFFILICYHTPYAPPYIYPPLAFYALDHFVRLLRYRVKDAALTAKGEQMTIIAVENSHKGWVAGQHVLLRVFFSGRVFESHPLSITNAPASHSVISSSHSDGQLVLGARVVGDWTRALNNLARMGDVELSGQSVEEGATRREPEVGPKRVMVMIDGPYGGMSFDLGRYENVLLFAGGAGVTFTMGVLDDIIGRIVRLKRRDGERTRRIEFAWCVKSFGCIDWFAPQLAEIATAALEDPSISLHIKFFVTCFCDPEAAPVIPNSEITIVRPSIYDLLVTLIDGEHATTEGLAVASSGPESLTDETRNAVAKIGPSKAAALGGVALHTEVFCL